MKVKSILITPVLFATILTACNSNSNKSGTEADAGTPAATTDTSQVVATATATPVSNFDISKIPVSDKDLGTFPFFSLPQGLAVQNKPIQRSYDRLFVPIDGIMTPIEGKVWKSYIVKSADSKEDWSLPYFEKSYDDAITSAGGVKIFDAKVSKAEMDRIKEKATYLGEEGSIDYWNDPVSVYVIHRADGGDVYIQVSGNTASGSLQIIQKAPFKQTITILKSDEIKKDLDEKGKAVLHINFDTDKASLKPDGKDAVAEIIKVLQADKNLKLDINGYTDNSGNDAHNLKLSQERAATVLNTIVAAGIEKSRLNSQGFGSKDPISDNSSEDGKAQNRRVELIKK